MQAVVAQIRSQRDDVDFCHPLDMHDPGHVILRRALRVALLVPVTYFVLQVVLGWTHSALAAAFACFSMLAFADLGGPRKERLTANALLGLNGVVLVALGSYLA